MGTCGSNKTESQMKLQDYGEGFFSPYGNVRLFRYNSSPFYFVMRIVQAQLTSQQNQFLLVSNSFHSQYTVKLHGHQKAQNLCNQGIHSGIFSFWDYFNFNLLDLQNSLSLAFKSADLWLVALACIDTAFNLHSHKLYPDFNPAFIFISPNGIPKIWAYHLLDRYNNFNISNLSLYSPEQLDHLRLKLLEGPPDSQRSVVFSIGLLILMLIQSSAEKLQYRALYLRIYDFANFKVDFVFLKNLISKHRPRYQSLIDMVQSCLAAVQIRPSLQFLLLEHKQDMNAFHSLRLRKSEQLDQLKSIEQDSIIKKDRYLNKLIQSKQEN